MDGRWRWARSRPTRSRSGSSTPATYEPAAVQLGGQPRGITHVGDVEFSADGRVLAATFNHFRPGSSDVVSTSAFVWDVSRPARPIARIRTSQEFAQLALSPRGDVLYVESEGLTTRTEVRGAGSAMRPAGPEFCPVRRRATPDRPGRPAAGGPGRRRRGRCSTPGPVTLVRRLPGTGEDLTQVRMSHDGTMVAAYSSDRSVLVWDVRSGRQVERIEVDSGNLWGLTFGADDQVLYTAGIERELKAWDIAGDRRFIPRVAAVSSSADDEYLAAVVAPDGGSGGLPHRRRTALLTIVATRGREGRRALRHRARRLRRARLESGRPAPRDRRPRRMGAALGRDHGAAAGGRKVSPAHVSGVEFLPDGQSLVVGDREGRIMRLDGGLAATPGPVARLDDGERVVWLYALPDGTGPSHWSAPASATAGADLRPRARVGSRGPGHRTRFVGARCPSTARPTPTCHPDGKRAVVGSDDGEVLVLDLATGKPLRPPYPAPEHRSCRRPSAPAATTS